MQLFVPEIFQEARGLSPALSITGLVLGFFLWLTGCWGHRFWIVLAATVMAGLHGLQSAPIYQVQPLVAGLLLAVAAGVLALALVRVVAFTAGGFAVWMAIHHLAPAAWDEPLVCFLGGGLVGLWLFRIWTMVLTSFTGALLMGYSGLCLADRLGKLDAAAVTDHRALLLNWAAGAVTLAGLAIQFLLDRRRARRQDRRREDDDQGKEKSKRYQSSRGGSWFQPWNNSRGYRRAG